MRAEFRRRLLESSKVKRDSELARRSGKRRKASNRKLVDLRRKELVRCEVEREKIRLASYPRESESEGVDLRD